MCVYGMGVKGDFKSVLKSGSISVIVLSVV